MDDAAASAGQVVDGLRRVQVQAVEIEYVDVGLLAGLQQAAVVQPYGLGSAVAEHFDDGGQGQAVAAPVATQDASMNASMNAWNDG